MIIRQYMVRRTDTHPELDVRVLIGMPRAFPDASHGDYYCPYQITGLGSEEVRHVGGVDAVQALELAIDILPTALDALRQSQPGLGWEDAPDGDYGFSRAVSRFVEDGAQQHNEE